MDAEDFLETVFFVRAESLYLECFLGGFFRIL